MENEIKQNYDRLKRIHLSTNKAVINYEGEIKRLNAAIELLLEEKKQWVESKEKWSQIMQQTITSSNAANSKVSDEIQCLREENRKLREETANLKGG